MKAELRGIVPPGRKVHLWTLDVPSEEILRFGDAVVLARTAWRGVFRRVPSGEKATLLINCVFVGNAAGLGGGALYSVRSSMRIVNCSFGGNTAGLGGATFNDDFSFPVVTNSILWANTPDQVFDSDSLTRIMFSDIQGGWDRVGSHHVLDIDPMFVDREQADLRLLAASPCIDAGSNTAVPSDDRDLDDDGDTAERLPVDRDGNPRFADDPDTDNTGCGEPAVVDMGAYEFPGESVNPVRVGDVNGDGVIDFTDVLTVLAGWGSCDDDDCCLEDVDFSGVVDFTDLLAVLAEWT